MCPKCGSTEVLSDGCCYVCLWRPVEGYPIVQPSGIEAEVCKDIVARQQMGIAKYKTTVAENPLSLRDWLQHAYEEVLDNAIYLKRAIAEIDHTTTSTP